MIILITGTPGSGKSLYAVNTLLPSYLKEGRKIYTNINNLRYHEHYIDENGEPAQRNLVKVKNDIPASKLVHSFSSDDFDWQQTPKGSVVVYDEAQQFFPTSGRAGLSDDSRILNLDTHRHSGYDIIFITQNPTLIHSHIRKFVGKHYHLYRKHGAEFATIYSWDQCVDSPSKEIGEDQPAIKEQFKFNKEAYRFYKSSEIHTHKFKLPKKAYFVLFGIIVLLVVLSVIFYKGYNAATTTIDKFSDVSSSFVDSSLSPESSDFGLLSPSLKPKEKRNDKIVHDFSFTNDLVSVEYEIGGCASMDNKCICYDGFGYPLDLSLGQCLSIINMDILPRRIKLKEGSSSSSEPVLLFD